MSARFIGTSEGLMDTAARGTRPDFQQRRDDVAHHFRHVHRVCPFSGVAVIRDQINYVDLPSDTYAEPTALSAFLVIELDKLLNDPKKEMALLFMDADFKTHDQAHLAAKKLLVELSLAGLILGNSPDTQVPNFKDKYWSLFKEELKHPRLKINKPSFGCSFDESGDPLDEKSLFCMALNPLYHPRHPRFSPHPVLALTKISTLKEAMDRDPTLEADITRRALLGIVGSIYPQKNIEELERAFKLETFAGERIARSVPDPTLDHRLILGAFREYDKGLYVYPPQS